MMSRMGRYLLLFQGGLGRIAGRQLWLDIKIRDTDLVDVGVVTLLHGQLCLVIGEVS
jgi:hypothetical protein